MHIIIYIYFKVTFTSELQTTSGPKAYIKNKMSIQILSENNIILKMKNMVVKADDF